MKNDLMSRQLDKIREAYDSTVEQYRQGINPIEDIPEDIKNTPYYKSLVDDSIAYGTGAPDIREYLNPESGMRFLDTGCSANLINYRLDSWPSDYYGVDISPELIGAMRNFAVRKGIDTGGLYVSDAANLPFDDEYFDIAAVIGVLEYGTLGYIGQALAELNRVCRREARVVIDIPNKNHPHAKDMVRLEKCLGRHNLLHARSSFEKLLAPLFTIDKTNDSLVMIKYYVRARK